MLNNSTGSSKKHAGAAVSASNTFVAGSGKADGGLEVPLQADWTQIGV